MSDLNHFASGVGVDELAGFPSREGIDPITGTRGSNQWLGHTRGRVGDFRPHSPFANKIPRNRLPLTSGPPIGKPDAANPLGRGAGESVNSD